MSDIFLSYSNQDRERARPIVSALEQEGFSVWWDRKIGPGKSYEEVIEAAIDAAHVVVVLWSSTSVTTDWVKVEANEGLSRKVLVPALIDAVRPPIAFRMIQAARLIGWPEEPGTREEFRNLVDAVRSLVPTPAAPAGRPSDLAAKDQIDNSARLTENEWIERFTTKHGVDRAATARRIMAWMNAKGTTFVTSSLNPSFGMCVIAESLQKKVYPFFIKANGKTAIELSYLMKLPAFAPDDARRAIIEKT